MSRPPVRVIYIMGVEHNGSTFLGVTLGNDPQAEFVGELSLLPREGWMHEYPCACGLPILDCPHWAAIRARWEVSVGDSIEALVQLEEQFDRHRRLPELLALPSANSYAFARYGRYTIALYQAVLEVTGKAIVIDSSKRFSRALALSRVGGIDLRLIHLLRDARGVAYSWSKPTRPRQRAWWNAALRWDAFNAASSLVAWKVGKERTLQVRYEAFLADPATTLQAIGRFAGMNLEATIELLAQNGALAVGHIGVGNGFLQRRQSVTLDREIDWPAKMPPSLQRRVWHLTAPLMKRYGYRR